MNTEDHMKSAEAEARLRGMSFLVDGKHVDADRVMILSLPDTIGPISDMRRAKIDAQSALKDMEAFASNVSRPLSKQQVEITGQHIGQLMDAVGLKKEPHWDNTYLGMHSFISMVDIEAKVRELRQDFRDAVKMLDDAHRDLNENDPGIRMNTLRMIGGFLSQLSHEWYPVKRTAMRAYGAIGRDAAVVVDGMLVTDPELAAPITEAVGGTSVACGGCGKLFDSKEPGDWFCAACR